MGRPHWCSLSSGPIDDHRTTRVVDALAEQVLAEPTLLALQHVRERLQRALVRTRDRLAAAAVVEQRVDGLLQHALLVADDDLGSVELLETAQTVVAVDDAAIEIVEIRRREPATVERDERTQIRRDHRDDRQHHPLGLVAALAERLDDLEALRDLLALRLGGDLAHLGAQRLGERRRCRAALEQLEDRLGAHAGVERVVAHLVEELAVALLGEELVRATGPTASGS